MWLDHACGECPQRDSRWHALPAGGLVAVRPRPTASTGASPFAAGPPATGPRSSTIRSASEWVLRHPCRRERLWTHPPLLGGADFLATPNGSRASRCSGSAPTTPTRRATISRRQPQLYNLDCVAYESLLLGLFTIWRGQPTDRAKPNEVCVGFSRDGFHWSRPDRRAFIPVSEKRGDWNWGNVQSAGGGCLVVGDQLYFYVSGRAGVPGSSQSGVCTTSLATLRRDGFASLDAGPTEGVLTTRRLRFQGQHLFVNADADAGELQAEVLDANGQTIAPFTRENCLPLELDATRAAIRWRRAEDLTKLAGRPVRLRFYLTRASLYSFWVSPAKSGASHGYVAAGGPGLPGPVDTTGDGT